MSYVAYVLQRDNCTTLLRPRCSLLLERQSPIQDNIPKHFHLLSHRQMIAIGMAAVPMAYEKMRVICLQKS